MAMTLHELGLYQQKRREAFQRCEGYCPQCKTMLILYGEATEPRLLVLYGAAGIRCYACKAKQVASLRAKVAKKGGSTRKKKG